MERRLAAILAADVAGFSRLVEKDETATLNQLKVIRSEIIQPTISRHRGRLFKQMGDGFLVEFASAINAANCAVEWQSRVADLSKNQFRFRIGLHVGEVVVDAEDLLGDGVNVASRLEQIAPEAGIALSDAFREQIQNRVGYGLTYAGSFKLKNLERPREVWLIERESQIVASKAFDGPGNTMGDAPSMAVLPFANLTGDASLGHLSLGIADQLASDLGHVPWFFVSAQAASFALSGGNATKTEIGSLLGVRYLIDGTLQKAAERLRVVVRLIDAGTGRQLWSSSFTCRESELFDLQDNLARTVIGEVEPRMRQIEVRRSEDKHGNLTAFDYYLRALPHIRGMSKTGMDAGLALLHKAIEYNPKYPAAHGLVAWLMTLSVPQGHAFELETGIRHAEKAVTYGVMDSEALSSGGYALGFFKWQPELGLGYLGEAYALNPNSARTHDFMGWLLLYSGDADQALQYFEDSLRLSPVDEFAFRPHAGKAFALLFLQRPDEAILFARKALTANPNFTVCHRVLAPALMLIGNDKEAQKIVSDLLHLHPALTVSRFAAETRFVHPGYKQILLDGLLAAGLPK